MSFVDERASDEQCQAILDAYHGRLGGHPADLAGLVGAVAAGVAALVLAALVAVGPGWQPLGG